MSPLALAAYLSETMTESEKLSVIRREMLPLAQMLETMTGCEIVKAWGDDDLVIENAFVNAGWL